MQDLTLRVQVPNNHILTQNLFYNHYYQNPEYQIVGYMDPKGLASSVVFNAKNYSSRIGLNIWVWQQPGFASFEVEGWG